tara:strand:- start:2715 stop:2858 length:144 start_codon:yes stop_codon:yes gene_type:complete
MIVTELYCPAISLSVRKKRPDARGVVVLKVGSKSEVPELISTITTRK